MSPRVLVMRGGALGDFILGLPALRAIREAFPDAHLELIAPRAVLPLASYLVDSAASIELAENSAFFGDGPLAPHLAKRYAGLDLAVVWLTDPDGVVRRNFERLGARQILQTPALPPKDARVHAMDNLLSTLRPVDIPQTDSVSETESVSSSTLGQGLAPRWPVVLPSYGGVEHATAILESLGLSRSDHIVAVHPGSGGRWKCWPPERFGRVIERVEASGLRSILVQGPADDEAVGAVLAEIHDERPPVVKDLSVEDLAGLLSLCAAYLGNDSGVTHLAAAVGAPTVALFGPTDPAVWGPRGERVVILRGREGKLEEIAVEQALESLERLLDRGA